MGPAKASTHREDAVVQQDHHRSRGHHLLAGHAQAREPASRLRLQVYLPAEIIIISAA